MTSVSNELGSRTFVHASRHATAAAGTAITQPSRNTAPGRGGAATRRT